MSSPAMQFHLEHFIGSSVLAINVHAGILFLDLLSYRICNRMFSWSANPNMAADLATCIYDCS